MKKHLSIGIFLLAITPSIAFASWWNPFTWGIFSSVFHSKEQTQVIVSSTTQQEVPKKAFTEATTTANSTTSPLITDSDMTLCNGQYYKKCEFGQLLVCPTDIKVEAYCSIPKTPKVKSSNELIPTQKPKTTPVSPPTISTEIKSSIATTTTSLDFKPQVVTLLISAKANYVELIKYADECALMASDRKAAVEKLIRSPSRAEMLSSAGSDEFLTKIYTAFYDLGEAEISNLESYRIYCGVTTRNSLSNNVKVLDDEMIKLKNYDKPMTSNDLVNYQVAYFGTNNYTEGYRSQIKIIIDKISSEISQANAAYTTGLSRANAYIDGILGQTSSRNNYIPPPPLVVPQLPKTTNCTISGDGGVGLQAYVNCTTY